MAGCSHRETGPVVGSAFMGRVFWECSEEERLCQLVVGGMLTAQAVIMVADLG